MNNLAIGYFFLFVMVEGTIGSGKFIKNINITVDTIETQSIDAGLVHVEIGFWTILLLLAFFLSRLDTVCRLMKQLYVKSICQRVQNAPIDSQIMV